MDELGAATVLSLEEAAGLEKALKVRKMEWRKEGEGEGGDATLQSRVESRMM